jgi:hypothetical protein
MSGVELGSLAWRFEAGCRILEVERFFAKDGAEHFFITLNFGKDSKDRFLISGSDAQLIALELGRALVRLATAPREKREAT